MTNENIKAVILAAGKGTRMKSDKAKVLHKTLSKSLVQRVIDSVLGTEIADSIYVIVGHQAEEVKRHLHEEFSPKTIHTVLQDKQLGTGDAVYRAYDELNGFNGTVIILCGDTPLITTETLNSFIKHHKENECAVTVMSAIFNDPTNYGRIVRNEKNILKKIVEEKDATSFEKAIKEVNAGIYCIEWNIISPAFSQLTTDNEQGEYYLTDIIDWAVNNELKADAYVIDNNDEIFGINSKAHLAQATQILNQRKIQQLLEEGVTIVDPNNTWISPETEIGKDSIIFPGCYIEGINMLGDANTVGPNTYITGNVSTGNNVKIEQSKVGNAQISNDCIIGPFAHIREHVQLGANTRVGNFVEIKKSQVTGTTNIAHLSYIGDSQIGKDVNIGAGTITANYDALSKIKSKTTIQDGVKIGSNSVLVAPVTIQEDANIAAGSIITKDIPKGALAITRATLKILDNWVTKRLSKLKNN